MKSVFIHIGAPKTGSSAIQKHLSENSGALEASGVLYPVHDVDPNGVSSGNLLAVYDRDKSRKLTLNQKKVDDLKKRFMDSACHTLVLSSEFFFVRAGELAEPFDQAVFVAYVRSSVDAQESMYNQGVKRQKQSMPFAPGGRLNTRHISTLKEAVECLGSKRFLIKGYAEELLEGGDVVSDFLATIGLPKTGETNYVNASYTLEALEFKRWANSFQLPRRLDRRLDWALQSYTCGIKNYSLIPPAVYERYRQQAKEVLRSLTEVTELVGEAELLLAIDTKAQKPYYEQNLSAEQISGVLEFLYRRHRALFHELTQYLDASGQYGAVYEGFMASGWVRRLRAQLYKRVHGRPRRGVSS